MEVSFKSRLYPCIFSMLVKKALSNVYTSTELRHILNSAKKEYSAIINRTPNMGGKANCLIDGMYSGSYLIALYKQVSDRITIEQFGEILLQMMPKKQNVKRDPTGEQARQELINNAEWGKKNKDLYPWTWQLKVKDGVKDKGLYFEYTNCGLYQLCKAEGVPEFTNIMCETDYLKYKNAGCTLIRNKTLAKGDDCCDFWLVKNED